MQPGGVSLDDPPQRHQAPSSASSAWAQTAPVPLLTGPCPSYGTGLRYLFAWQARGHYVGRACPGHSGPGSQAEHRAPVGSGQQTSIQVIARRRRQPGRAG
ncbi:hypothetical protein H1C71_011818 [Ictidomys tridecemlineatus]|nr:hypothetical protein H1C71_011818 [Ictidomys tridecemlineatus]